MTGKTLVVGAHGVIGSAAAARLRDGGREVVTLARRGPVELPDGTTIGDHLQVDLLDAPLQSRTDITDVVYAAYTERETMAATVAPNVTMLANVLAGLPSLEHVVLIGGGKSYGEHLGDYKTPARESDPRFLGPIFYNDQEDLLWADAARRGYSWTVLRPDGVLGVSLGSPMNLLTGLAVFATISAHHGVPLRFPGTPAAWRALHQATDARIVAGAIEWALGSPAARNEVFNVTNGDHFRWEHLWPDLAGFFGLPSAPPQPMPLLDQMADKHEEWDGIVDRHALRPLPMTALASWPFIDGWLASGADMVQSTIKIRQAGFTECLDTHDSFLENLDTMRKLRLIP
ncbi:SDR family oxidoreductase [Amycolatopsis jejuensis]|uniref:SDR family oxidoreductase n=1 Tax=Amycolatopsis jejuensis TaxID=330084 RepID=UPI000524B510|nr:SDR family oxidoreductase [Amycolatopsis jejuensis]